MKILITGGNGLVGSHFVENYHPGLRSRDIILVPSAEELNITDQKSIEDFFSQHKPDAIIHFAAFTDVSKAEKERNDKQAPCWIVNVESTANLIKAAGDQTYFIYISTDVVFSGSKNNPGPYAENNYPEENPNLLSWYGWTKREGEKLISENLKSAAILRISNPVRLYYPAKLDYLRKILSLFDTGKLYPMFNDQYLTLTYINDVTKTLIDLLRKKPAGIFHASSSNVFTPYKLANLLIEKARKVKNVVPPTSIKQYLKNNPFRYPQYGGLKVEYTQKILGLKFMRWEEIVRILAKQFLTSVTPK